MKAFKITDFLIQIVLIVSGLVFIFRIDKQELDSMAFFITYFVVGVWQVGSVAIHLFYKAPYQTIMRRLYLLALVVVTVLTLLVAVVDRMIIFVREILLFFSPVMSLYYLVVCFVETKQLLDSENAQ